MTPRGRGRGRPGQAGHHRYAPVSTRGWGRRPPEGHRHPRAAGRGIPVSRTASESRCTCRRPGPGSRPSWATRGPNWRGCTAGSRWSRARSARSTGRRGRNPPTRAFRSSTRSTWRCRTQDPFRCFTTSQGPGGVLRVPPAGLRPFRRRARGIVYHRTKTVVRRHVAPGKAVPLHPEAVAFAGHYGFDIDVPAAYRPTGKPRVATAPLRVDAGGFVVVLVETVAVGSDIHSWFTRRQRGVGSLSLRPCARVCGLGRRRVEAPTFVVLGVPGDEPGVVPDLDGFGGYPEAVGHLGQGEHAC